MTPPLAPLSMDRCQRRLAVLWFGVGLFLFLLMAVQSALGHYGDRVKDAWGWFLPTVMPTLSLMLGVFIAQDRDATANQPVSHFLFRLTFTLSLVYLLLVAAVLFAEPLTPRPILDLMQTSSLWLGPLQGLVALGLGVFFVREDRDTRCASA